MTAKPRYTYRFVREWSAEKADYTYFVYVTRYFGGKELTLKGDAGDKDWAKKNAANFGVEIEDE